jgi:hypothetical protein
VGWWQRGVEEREDGELERLSGPDLERNGQADGRGSSPRPGGAATPGRAGTMRILLHAAVLLHVLRARTHTTAPSRWSVIFFQEHKHGLSSQARFLSAIFLSSHEAIRTGVRYRNATGCSVAFWRLFPRTRGR